MGGYLNKPVTDKVPFDGTNDTLHYGASSMQGWRMLQEDAHNCTPDFDEKTSLFAVYDGHGGPEVALYTAQKLPDFIKATPNYKAGDVGKALEESFLGFDETILKADVVEKLKDLAGIQTDEEETEDEVSNLFEEADMPLDKLIQRYTSSGETADSSGVRMLRKKENILSPAIRPKKEGSNVTPGDGASADDDVKLKLSDKLLNGHSPQDKSVPDSTDNLGNEAKSSDATPVKVVALDDSVNECSASSTVESKELQTKCTQKQTEVHCSSEAVSCDSSVSVNKSDSEQKEDKNEGVSSTTTAPSGDLGGSSSTVVSSAESVGGSSASADASSTGSVQVDQPGSSTGRARKKRSAIIPEEGEDESSFDEDEETTDEELDSDESPEPWKTGSGSDSEEESEEESDEEGADQVMTGGEYPGTDSGCTAVVAVLKEKELYVANAGDSRCVLCRGGKAIDLSEDHKPEDDIERTRIAKAGGRITMDGRVNGGLNLSRAIGDHCYKKNEDLPAREQMITALPDIRTVTLEEADEFMVLACDGIWNVMSSQDVVNFVRERIEAGTEKLSSICDEMFDLCLAPNTMGDGTGCDNMTCIIVNFRPTVKKSSGEEESDAGVKRKADEELDNANSSNAKKSKVSDTE